MTVPGILGWIGLFCTHDVIIARICAFWAGSGTGSMGIILPCVFRQSFSGKDYTRILARINVFAYLTVSFTTGLYGYIYDWCGKKYHPVLTIVIISFGLAAIIGLIVFHKRPMKTMSAVLTMDRSSDDAMADVL